MSGGDYDRDAARDRATASSVGLLGTVHESLDVRACGLGHVFGTILPTEEDFTWFTGKQRRARQQTRPKELNFIRWIRVGLCLTTASCVATPIMYLFIVNDDGHETGVNKTDAFGPLAVQVVLLTWLLISRFMIHRLAKEQAFVSSVTQYQAGGSIASESQYDTHLLNLQSSDVVDLEMPLDPKLVCPKDGSQLEDARSIVRHIAYRGIQLSKSTPLFRGIPFLPEAQNFGKSGLLGFAIAGFQAMLLRISYNNKSLTTSLSRACFWMSTMHFVVALFIFYSLLMVILLNLRQQSLMVGRFSDMMIRQRACKTRLPYFILNSTQNLRTWYAVRQFLVAHVTRQNALSVLIEPAFAMLILAIIGASITLVVRHLFDNKDTDLFSSGLLTVLGTSLIFVSVMAYFGVEIGSLFDSHCDVLANIQYEATKKWNSAIEELEQSPPLSRSQTTADQVHFFWSIRRYANDLLDICRVDKHHPNVFGTSFSSMKWWLVIGLLVLNSVLFFALRHDERHNPWLPANTTMTDL